MKRMMAPGVLLFMLFCGCATIAVNEFRSEVSDTYVKSLVGEHAYVMINLDEKLFKHYSAAIKRSIDRLAKENNGKAEAKYDGWVWEENRFFLFELRHLTPYDIRKGDFTFTMTDAKGVNQLDEVMFIKGHFADGVQTKNWFIRAKKAIVTANISPDSRPVTLTVDFFKGQKKEFRIVPNK